MEGNFSGINTFYIKTGHGPVNLVFLHGWGTDLSSLETVIKMVEDRYTIYALDLPGFGKTDEPPEVYGVDEYALFVKGFIDSLGIADPVLVGHSNGGRIAILLAAKYMKISKMILMDSAGIRHAKSIGYYIKVYSYKLVKLVLLHLGKRGKRLFDRYRKNKGSKDYQAASDRMKAVLSKIVREDLRKYLPQIETSTLLFWGEKDTYTPISDAKEMCRLIKDAGLVTVKGAGHYSYLEDPRLFVRVLDRFLGG